MAIVRDLFSGLEAAKVFSRLMLVMGVAPVLAPTVGSELLRFTQWRGVFVALAALGVVLVAVTAFGLTETLPPHRRRGGGVVGTIRAYGSLLRDRTFVGLVLTAGLAMAALFAYVSGSSFVYQQQYGLNVQEFGVAFGAGAVGLITATQLNVRLLRWFSPQQILVSALTAGSVAGLGLLACAVTGAGGLAAILGFMWVVLAAAGLAFPNAPALALSRHGEVAGTAAALLGALQFGIGALAAPLVGALGTGSVPMAIVVAGGMVSATAVLVLVVRPWQLSEADATEAVHIA
jgi:DHA1 family bicyclomycin/chloramphenicol resistance-like MFS transporter